MGIAEANPEWAVGFEDECWWSRVALPTLNAWSANGEPLRLVQRSVAKDDSEPKAISCYGLYVPEIGETWLRFVDGRPVSSITTRFLSWCTEKLRAAGKKFLLLVWDNASWHISKELRRWLGKHNRELQEQRLWGEDRQLPSSEAESVAERHRAQVGTRETEGRGVRRASRDLRARREGLRSVRLSASRASHHSPGGRLIMH